MLKNIQTPANKKIKYHADRAGIKVNTNLASLGILIIIIGFAIVFISALTSLGSGQKDTKVAVGGFIGFIPFGFGNDKKLIWALIMLMGLAMLFFFAMNFFLQHRFK